MKKLPLLLGAGVGFVLGSRAGSEPYRKVEAKVRKVAGRPETQRTVDQVKGMAREQADAVVQKVGNLRSPGDSDHPSGDAEHPAIDDEAVAGAGQDAADRGITGLEVSP